MMDTLAFFTAALLVLALPLMVLRDGDPITPESVPTTPVDVTTCRGCVFWKRRTPTSGDCWQAEVKHVDQDSRCEKYERKVLRGASS